MSAREVNIVGAMLAGLVLLASAVLAAGLR